MTFATPNPALVAVLTLGLLAPLPDSAATTLDNLAECRSASTDNFSFRECVGLQHQASETLLSAIENSWREYLESAVTPGADNNGNEDRTPGASGNSETKLNAGDVTEESGKIIGDSGAAGESGNTVINICLLYTSPSPRDS